MDFKSGRLATATLDGTELPITGWSISPKTEMVVFRNSLTGRYSKKEPTFLDAEFSLKFDFDFDANPFGAPIELTVGERIENVKLYLDGTSGKFWDIPEAIVVSTPQSAEVDGKIETSVDFSVDGEWTPPT